MKKIYSEQIIEEISKTLVQISYELPEDVYKLIKNAFKKEKEKYSKKYLGIILENIEYAKKNKIPICQDTGIVVVFVEIGDEVKIEKGKFRNLDNIIMKGVEEGSKMGFLRNSIVDPIKRINTKNNCPPVIHYFIKEGNKLKITILSKGFGSENVSRIKMLNPSEGKKGIEKFIIETVKKSGSLPCPPLFVGVGIGGTFEKSSILSKYALLKIGKYSEFFDWEREIIEKINKLKIGPGGFGGETTVLDLKIESYPTHIAGLPVSINISCWAHRMGEIEL